MRQNSKKIKKKYKNKKKNLSEIKPSIKRGRLILLFLRANYKKWQTFRDALSSNEYHHDFCIVLLYSVFWWETLQTRK